MRSPLIADSVLPMTKLAKTLRGVVSEAWLTRHLLEQPQGAPPQGAPPAPPAPAPQAGPAIDPNTLPPEVAALVQQDPSILQNPELLQQLIAAAQQSAAGQPAPGQPPAGAPPAGDPGAPAGAPPGPPAGGPPPGPAGSSDPVGDLMRQQGLPTDPQAGGPQMPGQPGEDPAGGPPGAPPGPPPGPPTDYPSPNELPPEAQPPNAQDAAAIHQLKPFMNNGKDDLSPDGTPKPRPDRYRQPGPGDEGAIRRFLKDNPNATDDDFHNFAMRIGLDPHDAEGVVLKLANIGAKSSNDDSDGGEGEDDHKKSKKESIDPWFTRGPLSLDRRFLRPGLDESDANFRAAERQSAATGAPSDRAAHVVGLVRAGRLDELLRQHAERLHAAHEAVRAAHAAEQLHLELTRDNPDPWRDPKTGTLSRQHEAAKQARQQTVDEFKRDAETIGAGDRPEDLLHTQHFHGLTTTPHEHIQNPTPDDARDERLLHLTAIGHVLGLTPLRHGYGLSSLTMTGVRNTENQDVNKLQANVNRFTEVARKLYGKRSVQHSGHRMQFDPNGNEHSLYGSSLPERGFVQMPGVVLPRRAVPGRRVAGTSTGRAVGRINPPTVESDESGSHADHYLAITLDDASRAKLAAFGKGATADEKGFQIQPEHVTLKHDLTPEDMEWAQKHIGTAINMRATHHASMPGLHAVRVEPIGKHGRDLIARAGKDHPHVTVAYDHTRAKPAQSNDLLASSPGTRLSKYLNIGGTVQLLPKTPTAAHEAVDYIQRRFTGDTLDEGLFDSIRGLAQRVLGKTPPPSTTAHRQPRTPSIQTPEERQKEHEAAVDWYVKNQEVQAKKWAGVVHETLPKRPKARAGRASGPTAAPTAASLANTNILPHNPFDAQARARLASKTTGKLPVKNPDESGAESPEDLLLRQWANKRRSEQSIVRQSLAINEADTAARGAEREHRRDGTPETLARHFVNLQRTGQWNWDDRARQHAERMHAALNVVRDRREEEDRAKDAFQPAKEETHQRHLASAAHQSTVNDFKRDVDAYNHMNNTQHLPETLLLPSYYTGLTSDHAPGPYGPDNPNHHHMVALGHVLDLHPTWSTRSQYLMAMPGGGVDNHAKTTVTRARWERYVNAARLHHSGNVRVDHEVIYGHEGDHPNGKITPMKMPQFRVGTPRTT